MQKLLLRWAGLLPLLPGFLPAQEPPPSYEDRLIESVEFQPARQPLSGRDLKAAVLLRPGEPLHAASVAATIDRMFASGYYDDIQIHAQPRGDRVALRIVTSNVWFVGHVRLIGSVSSPPNRGALRNAAQLDLGASFHPEDLDTARDHILRLLSSNGFNDAQVHFETFQDPQTQQVVININVSSGDRARYAPPVIQGDTKLSNAAIIRATGWKVRFINRWRKVTQSRTDKGIEGIQKKYDSQGRLAANVDLTSLNYDPNTRRVTPTLNISAGPKITLKALEAKISQGRLNRYVPVRQEGAVDRDLLTEGARNLRDYFQSRGYPEVDVTFRQVPEKDGRETIEYFISKGERRKLVKVFIEGNHYFTTSTLRERMFLEPASLQFRYGRYSEAFRQRDEETIANLYRSNGFRSIQVTSTVNTNYQGKSGRMAVTFHIREGPQWFVDRLDTEGIADPGAKALVPQLSAAPGQPFSDLNVAADRSTLLSFYYGHGYLHATFSSTVSLASEPNRVNLRYRIIEGQRDFVRQVLISGLHNVKPSIVSDRIPLKPGDPLSPTAIQNSQRALEDLGLFANINTAIQDRDGDTTDKYVLYDFEEAHRYTMKVGVGAEVAQFGPTSTDISYPQGFTGFTPRLSVDANRLDFLGLGHTIALKTLLSSIEQQASLSYIVPNLLGSNTRSLTLTALYDSSQDILTFTSKRKEASVQLTQKLSRASSLLVRFAYRQVGIGNVVIPTLLVPQLLQPVQIGILSAIYVQDRRDDPADPHSGVYNSIDFGVASSYFGSQRDFTRLLARNATYYRIGKRMVLARQITFGTINAFNTPAGLTPAEAIPLAERFFGGGDITDRAFPEQEAGPRDIGTPAGPGAPATRPTGFPLGGNALLFNNTELRFPLLGDNIGGVLFHDIGNVYASIGDVSFRYHQPNNQNFNYAAQAIGFGIRYKTPIGPIRADLAYALNPTEFVGFQGTISQLLQCNPNLPPSQLPGFCTSVPQHLSRIQFFFSIGQTF
jgi:outer membrane protein insertion porin family